MIVIEINNEGYVWLLRSTTWTSQIERADKFSSQVEAEQALEKAKRFIKKSLLKKIVFKEVN